LRWIADFFYISLYKYAVYDRLSGEIPAKLLCMHRMHMVLADPTAAFAFLSFTCISPPIEVRSVIPFQWPPEVQPVNVSFKTSTTREKVYQAVYHPLKNHMRSCSCRPAFHGRTSLASPPRSPLCDSISPPLKYHMRRCSCRPAFHGRTSLVGLARTIYIRFTYGIFGREITKCTVIYGVYIRFWPTLLICIAT